MIEIKYFFAKWCSPCKVLSPIVDGLIDEGKNINKYDVDENESLAKNYGIRSVPCMLFLKDGKEFKRLNGMNTKEVILKGLEED